jgi:hypothetical protein
MPTRTRPAGKTGAARKPKATDPRLVKKPKQKMAVVVTRGDPVELMPNLMPALYGAVYKHKFAPPTWCPGTSGRAYGAWRSRPRRARCRSRILTWR